MRPDEISLPFAKPRPEAPQEQTTEPQPTQLPQAVSPDVVDRLIGKYPVTLVNDMRIIGDISKTVDTADLSTYICVYCKRFDLTCGADRITYGKLAAELSRGNAALIVNWEERVHEADKLVIYITYTEYLRIAKEAIDNE